MFFLFFLEELDQTH